MSAVRTRTCPVQEPVLSCRLSLSVSLLSSLSLSLTHTHTHTHTHTQTYARMHTHTHNTHTHTTRTRTHSPAQFLELRDRGVPNTGPKRPKGRKTVALTPAAATPAPAKGGSRGGRQETQKKKLSEEGPRKGERTPHSRLRDDIRELIEGGLVIRHVYYVYTVMLQ